LFVGRCLERAGQAEAAVPRRIVHGAQPGVEPGVQELVARRGRGVMVREERADPVTQILFGSQRPAAVQETGPPAMYRIWPDTKPAPSLTRKEIAAATSSTWPTRPTGMVLAAPAWKSSKEMPSRAAAASVMSATMKPGATALAVMPSFPSPIASVCVR